MTVYNIFTVTETGSKIDIESRCADGIGTMEGKIILFRQDKTVYVLPFNCGVEEA